MLDSERKQRGIKAEAYVCEQLKKNGFQIDCRNYRVGTYGEIDIVASRNDTIYVVEVRARQLGSSFGSALESISADKLRKLRRITALYLKEKQIMNKDVVILATGVTINTFGEIVSVKTVPVECL